MESGRGTQEGWGSVLFLQLGMVPNMFRAGPRVTQRLLSQPSYTIPPSISLTPLCSSFPPTASWHPGSCHVSLAFYSLCPHDGNTWTRSGSWYLQSKIRDCPHDYFKPCRSRHLEQTEGCWRHGSKTMEGQEETSFCLSICKEGLKLSTCGIHKTHS